jgi:hypothetical protein
MLSTPSKSPTKLSTGKRAEKLAACSTMSEQNFAEALERLQNMERVNNGNARTIEAPPVETKPPMPRLADRRYRRL